MHQPQQPSLRDLLRPLWAHKLVWIACVVIAVGASVVLSMLQTPTYKARASVSFQSENRELGIVGVPFVSSQTAAEVASAGAQTVIQQAVVERVKRALRSSQTTEELSSRVTTTVRPSSTLVVIEAKGTSGKSAQNLANEFARQGAAEGNRRVRRQYANAYRQLRRRRPPKKDSAAYTVHQEQLGRLQTLSAIARPAQVAQLAGEPEFPSSPRPLRNGFIAGILGLVVGLLAALIRDSFDRRLRTASDISGELHVPLMGYVSAEALGRSPHPDRNGSVANVDWEMFRILRRNLDFLSTGQSLRKIVVTSSQPEEGKTTVAGFLAFASAAAGKRTLLIDCDLRKPMVATRIGLPEAPGLTDFVAGRAEPRDILQPVRFSDPIAETESGAGAGAGAVAEGEDGPIARDELGDQFIHDVVCITSGTQTRHPVEVIRSERFMSMLESVSEIYDLIVIDTPPLLAVVDTLELLPQVDGALICVRANSTTRDQVRASKAALDRLPDLPTGFVVTGSRGIHDGYYGYGYGYS